MALLPSYEPGTAEAFVREQTWQFKTTGDELVLRTCPFCGREDWKFYLNNATGHWLCHHAKCGRKGNWFQFNREFGEQGAPIRPLPKHHDDNVLKHVQRWTLEDFAPFEAALSTDTEAQAYLASRALTMETARAWHLGVKTEKDGSKWLMFPYISATGEVYDCKYRHLREKRFRRKGGGESVLYGEQFLGDLTTRPKVLYIVEGEIDALSMWQAGFQPVVSTTTGAGSFKPRWHDLIVSVDPELLVIAYDSDVAGQNGAAALIRKFDDRKVINLVLPVKDANEFFKTHTAADFDALLLQAQPVELERVLSISSVLDMLEEQLFLGQGGCDGYPSQFADLNDMIAGGYWKGTVSTISGMAGIGKAQPLDTPVLTPSGFRPIGSLTVGDEVIGRSGQPVLVTGVFDRGILPVFQVSMDDGTSTVCCEDHLWVTQSRTQRTNKALSTVKPLRDIRLDLAKPGRRCHYIPLVEPVKFAADQVLPIDPYVLGVLLGDGCFRNTSPKFDNPEPDIQSRVEVRLPSGYYLARHGITCTIRHKRRGQPNAVKAALESLGLWGKLSVEKSIPRTYLLASVPDRLALLRGLLDTDGSVTEAGTSIEYSTSSAQLAKDVMFLARSLGAVVTHTARTPRYPHHGKPKNGQISYRLFLAFPNEIVPVSSVKHVARLCERTKYHPTRCIVRVDPIGERPCRCIAVEHATYVTNDFIVTHNTSFALQELLAFAKQDTPAYLLCLEMPEVMIMRKLIEHEFHIPMRLQTLHDVQRVRGQLEKLPLYLGYKGGPWDEIETSIRAAVKRYDLRVLAFDNVNYFVRSAQNQAAEIGLVTKRLKQLAVDLQLAILLIAQPRKFDDSDRMMTINDLKDSSSIGQDSDNVMMLWRRRMQTHVKNEEVSSGFIGAHSPYAILRVDKSRFSAGGEMTLYFDGAISTYRELTLSEKAELQRIKDAARSSKGT